jgi:hypothetical protein
MDSTLGVCLDVRLSGDAAGTFNLPDLLFRVWAAFSGLSIRRRIASACLLSTSRRAPLCDIRFHDDSNGRVNIKHSAPHGSVALPSLSKRRLCAECPDSCAGPVCGRFADFACTKSLASRNPRGSAHESTPHSIGPRTSRFQPRLKNPCVECTVLSEAAGILAGA